MKRLKEHGINEHLTIKHIDVKTMQDIQSQEEELLVRRGKNVNRIPEDIAVNEPLRENLLTLFICIYSKTPLFICGKPGSSKTISVNIIHKIFNSKFWDINQKDLLSFNFYKPIRLVYYQGSIQSTDQGIERVFLDAKNKLVESTNETPLMFFDEIGLAELSPYNPLKILHKYLEYSADDELQNKRMSQLLGGPRDRVLIPGKEGTHSGLARAAGGDPNGPQDLSIPFVGISNWTIDISKMNRNVYLSRPKPENAVLYQTALIILEKEIKTEFQQKVHKQDLSGLSKVVSAAYSSFRQVQFADFPHKNFHSLRDYYWFLKHIGQRVNEANIKCNKQKLLLTIESLYKNFAGYFYFDQDKGRRVYSTEGNPSAD